MSRGLSGRREDDGSADVAVTDVPRPVDSTLGLRIAAIFIILSAGLLGGVPPLFVKALRNQDSLQTFLIRAFSAGVILALAFVHILPDAIEELVDIGGIDYPLGGICVLVGLFVMVFIEHGAHLMYGGHTHGTPAAGGHGHAHGSGRASGPGGSGPGHEHDRSHSHLHRSGLAGGCTGSAGGSEPLLRAETAERWEEAEGDVVRRYTADGETPGCDARRPDAGPYCCPHRHAHAACGDTATGNSHHLHHRQQQQEQEQQQEQQQETDAKHRLGTELEQAQQQQQQQGEQEQVTHQRQLQQGSCGVEPGRLPAGGNIPAAAVIDAVDKGCGGAFARRSAGTALLHAAAAAGPPLSLPRPLAASSLPLLAHAGGGPWRRRDADSSSLSAIATSSKDTAPATEAAESAAPEAAAGEIGASASTLSRAMLLRCPTETHCHDCVSRASAPNWAAVVEVSSETSFSLRLRVVAYLFELGCIFHSFIIGMSLGVNRTSTSEVRALLLALSFHQALEGLSLASVINGGGFSTAKAAVMIATYSVTCPLGAAIGIGIAASYNPESTRARAAQGCLNGVSGGMLLYISLVQLVAEDMGKYLLGPPAAPGSGCDGADGAETPVETHRARGSGVPCRHGHGAARGGGGGIGCRIRAPSFLAFCLGAASMCLLAVWA